ncbi:formate dehydrogenase accessory sulfurtransferase FdhD [Pararhodobacter marinus]|uniref:formate dehydrogenase accessory sulfurtransferase FdhD n=1 Tax=Pararhodobacter marinus TaxID=2184063 RepID=UPI0035119237
MQGARPRPRLAFGTDIVPGDRVLPEEVAVALTFNGTTQAVMMATPDHLADFAYGFALTEGLARPEEIDSVDVVETARGLDVQLWVSAAAEARLTERRRVMAGPVGCGLCGIDSLEQAMRDMAPVAPGGFRLVPAQVQDAIDALPRQQALHDVTRSAHCAAFWDGARMIAAREDVGRHNALDKLAGALVRASTHPTAAGAVVLTSRVSIDLVQKVAAIGAPMIIAVSSPTATAVDLAEKLGITLIAQARPDRFELFTHSDRIQTREPHVR